VIEIPWAKHKWAKFAAVDKDGMVRIFRDEPLCDKEKGFWWHSKWYSQDVEDEVTVGTDKEVAKDWTNSMMARPKTKKGAKK
jgi:hypothetical protein